jgi:hypothetical protein
VTFKPRIRKPRKEDSDDYVVPDVGYYCTGITVGSGETPEGAYENWRRAFDNLPWRDPAFKLIIEFLQKITGR